MTLEIMVSSMMDHLLKVDECSHSVLREHDRQWVFDDVPHKVTQFTCQAPSWGKYFTVPHCGGSFTEKTVDLTQYHILGYYCKDTYWIKRAEGDKK